MPIANDTTSLKNPNPHLLNSCWDPGKIFENSFDIPTQEQPTAFYPSVYLRNSPDVCLQLKQGVTTTRDLFGELTFYLPDVDI